MPAEDVGQRSPDTTASRTAAGSVNTLSDALLLPAAQADPRAFAPLYERYVDRVYRYCLRRLGDEDEAADATSLIFTRALAALPRCQPSSDAGGSFRAWLFTIAHRVVVDVYRGAGRAPTAPLDDATGGQLRDRTATVEAITATQRAWLPCRVARSPLHGWALVSDRYLQEELFGIYSTGLSFRDVRTGLTEAAAEGMDMSYTWDPDIPADMYFPVIQPDQVVGLKDGRVVATVLWMNTSGEPADRNIPLSGIAFVQERGEWVIDEFTFGVG